MLLIPLHIHVKVFENTTSLSCCLQSEMYNEIINAVKSFSPAPSDSFQSDSTLLTATASLSDDLQLRKGFRITITHRLNTIRGSWSVWLELLCFSEVEVQLELLWSSQAAIAAPPSSPPNSPSAAFVIIIFDSSKSPRLTTCGKEDGCPSSRFGVTLKVRASFTQEMTWL